MKRSICVIDDDPIYQLIMKKVIERSAAFEEVRAFDNAFDALRHFRAPGEELPDLILLDINMPGMDGWEFLENTFSLQPEFDTKCTVYIVSSSIAFSDKERAEANEQICGFVSKPLSVAKLKEIAAKL